MRYVLHLFPFSTYCEKARWALDHLGVSYQEVTHYPGPHTRAIKKLSGQTSVPVLEDGSRVIAGSAAIIDHAMSAIPGSDLLPAEHEAKILEWQKRLDNIGATLRGTLFYDILQHPKLAVELLTAGQKRPLSGYGIFFRTMIPMLKRMLKQGLPDEAKARADCQKILREIAEATSSTGYIVGDRFTLADLAAASIFFPICMPEHSMGFAFTQKNPDIDRWKASWADNEAIPYIQAMYRNHRLLKDQ